MQHPDDVDRLEIECGIKPNGKVLVRKGDTFTSHGIEWEVVAFTNERVYSPFGLFGTPIVKARPLDIERLPREYAAEFAKDGVVGFCGDALATFVHEHKSKKRR